MSPQKTAPARTHRHRRRTVAAGVLLGLLAAVFTLAAPQPVTALDPPPPYEIFTGSTDDFYVVPSPLPPGDPGDLIRVQDVAATATSVTKRIMYHTIDGAGRDRAVTGTISYPTAAPPPGGWPVISLANGTVGLGSQCALSRTRTSVPAFGVNGVAVASDYVGMGPVGEVHAYLSRLSEGHSVLDAVRAARNLTAAGAGNRFVVLGGSQGGHGALSTNELGATYAPELDLLGTVALAPAAMFDRTYGPLDEIVTRVVGAMGLLGLSTEHPELVLSDYLTPAGLAAMDQMRTSCTEDIILQVLGVPFDAFYSHDPNTTEPARSLMAANDVGNVAVASPVLLVQGTADTTVFPARTRDLYARLCAVGQTVHYEEIPGADHGTVGFMDRDHIEAWLADRFAGAAAPDSCDDPVPTTTTPPTSVAPATTATPGATAITPPSTPDRVQPVDVPSAAAGPPTGPLPRTGAPAAPRVVLALLAVLLGSLLVFANRRHTRPADRHPR